MTVAGEHEAGDEMRSGYLDEHQSEYLRDESHCRHPSLNERGTCSYVAMVMPDSDRNMPCSVRLHIRLCLSTILQPWSVIRNTAHPREPTPSDALAVTCWEAYPLND